MEDKSIKAVQQISTEDIKNRIYTIRGVQVMLDRDLANIYGYTTKAFNQQVKNNSDKFPEDMMFQLSAEEVKELSRSKNLTTIMQTSGIKGGRVYLPYTFTEQGVYMLMTVLKGELATKQSIALVRMFKQMRQYLTQNSGIIQRLDRIEMKQLEDKLEADEKFQQIFKQLQNPKEAKAVLFFKGQMWDATSLIEDIIGKAKKSIILIDSYVDKKNLDLLSKKHKNVTVDLYTSKTGNKLSQKEISDFNNQYGGLAIKYTNEFHDRFLILDEKELYHSGASIKDAGKKAFELSIIEDEKQLQEILKRLV